jgi:hypothetical protein
MITDNRPSCQYRAPSRQSHSRKSADGAASERQQTVAHRIDLLPFREAFRGAGRHAVTLLCRGRGIGCDDVLTALAN